MDNNKGVANNPKPITRRAWEENSNSTPKTGEYAGKKVTKSASEKTQTPASQNTSEPSKNDTKLSERTAEHKDNTTTGNQSASDLEDKISLDHDWYITDIDSDISLEPSSGDKWELNGSLLDDDTSKKDMNNKGVPQASFRDNTPSKESLNRQKLHDDIINQSRKNLAPPTYEDTTAGHRASKRSDEQQAFLTKEAELKNLTTPPYMTLQQQLTKLTTENKEQIDKEIFVKNTRSQPREDMNVEDFQQQLAQKYPEEHITKAALLLNRQAIRELEDYSKELYLPPVTPALQKAYELVLKQYSLFAQIPDSEHFLWLMREYNQDKKNTNKQPDQIDWPTHSSLHTWILERVKTEHMTEQILDNNLYATEVLFPLYEPASSSSIKALQSFVTNRQKVEGDKYVQKLLQEANYYSYYEEREATLKQNDEWMEYIKEQNPLDSDDYNLQELYENLEKKIIKNKSPQAKNPTPSKIKKIIINHVLNQNYITDDNQERKTFVENNLKWFFQENNPIELEGLSQVEAQNLAQEAQYNKLMHSLDSVCARSQRYYENLTEQNSDLIHSYKVPPELLSECSPWHVLQTDEKTGLVNNRHKTNKDIKQFIEKTYSPWVFEQLKNRLPTLDQPHLPVTSNILKCIGMCLWDFGGNTEFNNAVKKNNCVSLIPFSQAYYPLSFNIRRGICSALAFEWSRNQGTKSESDFTESTGYNWDSKPFNFRHPKKENIAHHTLLFYSNTKPLTNAEGFKVLPGQGYHTDFPNPDEFIFNAIKDIGYITDKLESENSKEYPAELHDAIKNSKSKTQSYEQQHTHPLKIHDYMGLYNTSGAAAHAIACYYHIPSDGNPNQFKLFDANCGEVSFETLEDLDGFINDFILKKYYHPNTGVESVYHKHFCDDKPSK